MAPKPFALPDGHEPQGRDFLEFGRDRLRGTGKKHECGVVAAYVVNHAVMRQMAG